MRIESARCLFEQLAGAASNSESKEDFTLDCPLCKATFARSALKPYNGKLITRGLAELEVYCSQMGLGCKWYSGALCRCDLIFGWDATMCDPLQCGAQVSLRNSLCRQGAREALQGHLQGCGSFLCPRNSKGCAYKGTMAAVGRHEADCPYVEVCCAYQKQGCPMSAERRLMVPHQVQCEIGVAYEASERARLAQLEALRLEEERRRQQEEEALRQRVAEEKARAESEQRAREKVAKIKSSAVVDPSQDINIKLRVGLGQFSLPASVLVSERIGSSVLGLLATQALAKQVPKPVIRLGRDGSLYTYLMEWMLRWEYSLSCAS